MGGWNRQASVQDFGFPMRTKIEGTARVDELVRCVGTGRGLAGGAVNFYAYVKDGNVVCIDTGMSARSTTNGLRQLGLDPATVSHVFLTHSDFDHVGGLAALPGTAVYLSTDEGQMVDGTTARSFGLLRNSLYGREWTPCRDGEVVNAGGIKVVAIATPGHTPGSMSHLVEDRYLFVGDALRLVKGVVRPFLKPLVMDMPVHLVSLRKLAAVGEARRLFTAHTGHTSEVAAAMRDRR